MSKFLSIEIDNFNIKIIEAIKKGETLSICRYTSIVIDYGTKDGRIIDVNYVSNIINEELTKSKIKTK
ncbi:MAG: hypothetical protein GX818_08670 [Tissierellia bacterium]|nr:hypothetical protein [Tissierellia bacterium]